ncbi:hypothetical protein D3C78_1376240 [compost metagenome]
MDEENALQTHSFRSVADAMRELARSISYYCNNGWWRVYARLSWFVKFALKTLGRLVFLHTGFLLHTSVYSSDADYFWRTSAARHNRDRHLAAG